MSDECSAERRRSDLEDLINDVLKKEDRYSALDDINKTLKQLNDVKEQLEHDQLRLEVFECIALESDDPNIQSLRQQLFAAVKLMYSDEIDEFVKGELRPAKEESWSSVSGSYISSGLNISSGLISQIAPRAYKSGPTNIKFDNSEIDADSNTVSINRLHSRHRYGTRPKIENIKQKIKNILKPKDKNYV